MSADREAIVTDPAEHLLDVERQRGRLLDMVEEYCKREKSQDTIRRLLTAERDEARATVERVKVVADEFHQRSRDETQGGLLGHHTGSCYADAYLKAEGHLRAALEQP